MAIIKFLFWFLNALLATKWTVFSIEWLGISKNCRECYWKYVLRRMFPEFDNDK